MTVRFGAGCGGACSVSENSTAMRVSPIWICEPETSAAGTESGRPSSSVPLVELRSSRKMPSSRKTMRQCSEETTGSGTARPKVGWRPRTRVSATSRDWPSNGPERKRRRTIIQQPPGLALRMKGRNANARPALSFDKVAIVFAKASRMLALLWKAVGWETGGGLAGARQSANGKRGE